MTPASPAGIEMEHYSRALDEIYRLRAMAACEALAIKAHLDYASMPKGLRTRLEDQRARLEALSRGESRKMAYECGRSVMKWALEQVTGKQTLTRSEWEAEA